MRTSTRRFISIIIATGLTAGAIFVYGLLIVPTIDDINIMRSELAQKENLYTIQREAVDKIKNLFAGRQVPPLQETFNLALPVEDPQIASIVSQINGIAIINSVDINQLATQIGSVQQPPRDVPFTSGVGTVKVTFEVKGSYDSLKKFLEGIETNIRLIDVTQLNIDESAQGSNILNAKFTVDAYYQARTQQASSGSGVTATQLSK